MAKVVLIVDGGNVTYVGSNLEGLEVVVIDKDNLKEGMGYTDDQIDQIYERETHGLKAVDFGTPPEAEEVMVVQAYKAPPPWTPKAGEHCWEEVDGLAEFKLAKFNGYKEGCNYYKFDGVLPMAEILNREERIDPQEVFQVLKDVGDPAMLEGDFWHGIDTPAPDAPFGYDVNVWSDGTTLKMTAYAIIQAADGQKRTSTLDPLMTHEFTPQEQEQLLESTKTSIKGIAASATKEGRGLLDVLDELGGSKPSQEPKA